MHSPLVSTEERLCDDSEGLTGKERAPQLNVGVSQSTNEDSRAEETAAIQVPELRTHAESASYMCMAPSQSETGAQLMSYTCPIERQHDERHTFLDILTPT